LARAKKYPLGRQSAPLTLRQKTTKPKQTAMNETTLTDPEPDCGSDLLSGLRPSIWDVDPFSSLSDSINS